jgi:uncharacterized cupin superfamily protein
VVNVFDARFEYDDADPDGYRGGVARVGKGAGGEELTVKLYELPPGQALCPYHYEYVEEWLLLLEGALTLRTPAGERTMQRGELVCFPAGPGGAHKVATIGDGTARFLMFSSARLPAVAVYPDSDKVGVWTSSDADDFMFRRRDAHVGYYEGETGDETSLIV